MACEYRFDKIQTNPLNVGSNLQYNDIFLALTEWLVLLSGAFQKLRSLVLALSPSSCPL